MSDLPTTFVSETQLRATLDPSTHAVGVEPLTVANSIGVSNAVDFTFTAGPPAITSINPTAVATRYVNPTNLTVTGTDFADGDIVRIGGVNQPTTFVSATRLTAAVNPSALTAGTADVDVTAVRGNSGVLPLVVADFIANGQLTGWNFNLADHQLDTEVVEVTGVFAFIGTSPIPALLVENASGGTNSTLSEIPVASATMDSWSPNNTVVDPDKMKALPPTTVYTLRVCPLGLYPGCHITDPPSAVIGSSNVLPPPDVSAPWPTITFDAATVTQPADWTQWWADGVRHPIPFTYVTYDPPRDTAFSFRMGSSVYVGPEVDTENLNLRGPLVTRHATPNGLTGDVLTTLAGETLDVHYSRTTEKFHLSDVRDYFVLYVGLAGPAPATILSAALTNWVTSDAAGTFLLREPPGQSVAEFNHSVVKMWNDDTAAYVNLKKEDLTTNWTAAEVAALLDAQVTVSRDVSGVLVLAGPAAPTYDESVTGNAVWDPTMQQLWVDSPPQDFPPYRTEGSLFINGTDIGPMEFGGTAATPSGKWEYFPGVAQVRIEPTNLAFEDNTAFLQALDGTTVTVGWNMEPEHYMPVVTSITPASVQQPEVVTLTIIGEHFTPTTEVVVSGYYTVLPMTYISETELQVEFDSMSVGPEPSMQVTVQNGLRANYDGEVEVIGVPITLTSVTPNTLDKVTGPSPFPFTLIGTGFNKYTGVNFGVGQLGRTLVSDTQIDTSTYPESYEPGEYPVSVQNGYETVSNELPFTVTGPAPPPPPVISSLNPASISMAAGATTFDIIGTLFAAGAGVKVAGQWATGFVIASDTLITGVPFTPPGTGNYTVMVQNGGSTAGDSNTVNITVTA